jgi:hypothetical protein
MKATRLINLKYMLNIFTCGASHVLPIEHLNHTMCLYMWGCWDFTMWGMESNQLVTLYPSVVY